VYRIIKPLCSRDVGGNLLVGGVVCKVEGRHRCSHLWDYEAADCKRWHLFSTTNSMAEEDGILYGMGNPLLDISARVEPDFLGK
jgi:hypothetical protein